MSAINKSLPAIADGCTTRRYAVSRAKDRRAVRRDLEEHFARSAFVRQPTPKSRRWIESSPLKPAWKLWSRRCRPSADSYAEKVLEPLNDTIQRFSRALMTWSDEAIIYKAEHQAMRSELRPKAIRTGPNGEHVELNINPNKYFSEGQLSALSVSALLAASTSFRWSPWRALLMDDPLQHNDVIHASAFMDQMRQLVRLLNYQVIMSTHDSAEADFLVRKCRSANIPCQVHELTPSGDDGLVSQAA